MKRITHPALLVLFAFVICGKAQTPPPPPAPADAISAAARKWREFKHEAGNFAVTMPGEPAEISQSLDTQIGKVPLKLFTLQTEPATYVAMIAEYPIVFDTPIAVKQAIDTGRDIMLANLGAKLTSEKEITYGKYPGREWHGASARFATHSRIYVVNQRVYLIAVGMPADERERSSDAHPDAAKFLDSFKLIKEPDAPPASVGSLAQLEASAEKIALPDNFLDRPTAWREFSSKEYGFNIQFPSEPFQQSTPLVPNDRRLDIQLWMAKGNDVICQMLVQPMLAPPRDEKQRNILFKGLVAGIVDDGEMKLLSEEPISFRGHAGRAYKFQMASGDVYGKAFIIGARVYLMLVVSFGTEEGEKETARFFDSFTPLDAPASPDEPQSPPSAPPRPAPDEPETFVATVKISGGPTLLDKAIKKVEPDYPPIARAARAQGKVIVYVTISTEGKVIAAEVIQGHPLLRDAALQAVKQWEFKPTELSGAPITVAGELSFEFTIKP